MARPLNEISKMLAHAASKKFAEKRTNEYEKYHAAAMDYSRPLSDADKHRRSYERASAASDLADKKIFNINNVRVPATGPMHPDDEAMRKSLDAQRRK